MGRTPAAHHSPSMFVDVNQIIKAVVIGHMVKLPPKKGAKDTMNKIELGIIALLGVLSLAACEPISPPATKPAGPSLPASAVTGTVTYLVRSALPPTAVIEVVLQDVSRVDAPAETISTPAHRGERQASAVSV